VLTSLLIIQEEDICCCDYRASFRDLHGSRQLLSYLQYKVVRCLTCCESISQMEFISGRHWSIVGSSCRLLWQRPQPRACLTCHHVSALTAPGPALCDCISPISCSATVSTVSNRSKYPGQFRVRFQCGTEPLQQVSTQNPLLKSQHVLPQLNISVLIISQHNQYVDCAVLVTLSPPAFRFAIRQVFIESQLKTLPFRFNSVTISQPFNEYLSDCKCSR
jgi:hypothetical protein